MVITPQLVTIPTHDTMLYKVLYQQVVPGGPRNFDASLALTDTFTMVGIPADYAVQGVRIRNLVRFQAPTLTSLTLSIGAEKDGVFDYTFYGAPYELMLPVTDRSLQTSAPFASYTAAAHNIVARFTATGSGGSKLADLTAGVVEITFRIVPLL